jgi:hypothetical protein
MPPAVLAIVVAAVGSKAAWVRACCYAADREIGHRQDAERQYRRDNGKFEADPPLRLIAIGWVWPNFHLQTYPFQ